MRSPAPPFFLSLLLLLIVGLLSLVLTSEKAEARASPPTAQGLDNLAGAENFALDMAIRDTLTDRHGQAEAQPALASEHASRRFFVVHRDGNRVELKQIEPTTWPEIGGPLPPGNPFHARLAVEVEPFGPFVLVDGPTVRVAARPASDFPDYYLLGLQEAGGNVTWVQGEETLSSLTLAGGP